MSQLSYGPLVDDAGVTFRIWAPKQEVLHLRLAGLPDIAMQAAPNGWHTIRVEGLAPGVRYSFVLDNGLVVPDPASRFQPEDVHGPSEVANDTKFKWTSSAWSGRPWNQMVIYELQVGTFTQDGTFLAAIERLEHLSELGVTAIQLMPVNDFRG